MSPGHGRLAVGDRRDDPRPPPARRPTTSTSRSTTAGSSRSATSCCARCTRRATGPSTRRSRSIDRARGDEPWAVLTRRLAVRRRHRATGPRGRPRRGRTRDLPQPARAAAHAARQLRGLARAPRRLDVRRAGDGHEGLLDDRLRAGAQRAAARARRRALRRARRSATLGPQPPNFQAIVALNRGPLLGSGVEATRSRRARSSSRADEGALVVDVRTDQQFDEAHVPGAVCITALRAGFGSAGVDRRPRAGDRARRPRRRRRAEGRGARHRGRHPAARRASCTAG